MTLDSRPASGPHHPPPPTASQRPPTPGSPEPGLERRDGPAAGQDERQRLASIDVMRGITILGMLLVNNIALGKDSPSHLLHAGWNQGIHFADMVFPWFLLISGLSVPLAAASHSARGLDRHAWIVKVFTRTFLLIMLGCLVDSSIKGRMAFSLGVLQLIGLSYCVAALTAHLGQSMRLGLACALFATHTLVLLYAPWGNSLSGVIGPKQNFIYWLNDTYLKPFHLEGLFSVVSTSALVIVGTVMGDALRREEGVETTEITYLGVSGAVLIVAGKLLGTTLLYSKPLWTASYLLVAGGYGLVLLGLLRVLVDKQQITRPFYPFLVFGANALTVYVLPILFKMLVLEKVRYMVHGKEATLMKAYKSGLVDVYGAYAGGWTYTLSYILLWWLVLLVMHRRKIFLRV